MQFNSTTRVGIIVVLAILLFLGVYLFLTRFYLQVGGYTITATFTDAQGLTKGSTVSMAGVAIGTVERITLDQNQRAVVVMRINKQYHIPAGSQFVLRVGLLVGEKQIDIIPNRAATGFILPESQVTGVVPPRIEDLLPQGQKLLANLNKVVSDKQMQEQLKRIVANVELASVKLDRTMDILENIAASQQGNVRLMVQNLVSASGDVKNATGELSQFIKNGQVQGNITSILESTKTTAASLQRTSESMEKLATDPALQADIKATVCEARLTVAGANKAICSVNELLDRRKSIKLPTVRTSIEGIYNPEASHFRTDASLRFLLNKGRFFDLGMYDIGSSNKFIVEAGRPIGKSTDLRYGIYASQPAVGLDQQFSKKWSGNLNIYNPNNVTLDLISEYKFYDGLGVLAGFDNVFRSNQFTVGLRYNP